jgi:hypothetical protein
LIFFIIKLINEKYWFIFYIKLIFIRSERKFLSEKNLLKNKNVKKKVFFLKEKFFSLKKIIFLSKNCLKLFVYISYFFWNLFSIEKCILIYKFTIFISEKIKKSDKIEFVIFSNYINFIIFYNIIKIKIKIVR